MTDKMILVPGRRGSDTATWWCLTTGSTAHSPTLTLTGAGPEARYRVLDLEHGPFLIALGGLTPDTDHTMTVTAGPFRQTVKFRTWPARADIFRLAVGSCYMLGKDRGHVARDYQQIINAHPVDLRLLLGDQIYMDFNPHNGDGYAVKGIYDAPTSIEPFPRYREQWAAERFQRFLEATPTMMLADDHEFWNGFPSPFPFLAYASHPDPVVTAGFMKAFDVFQSSLNASASEILGGNLDAAKILRGACRSTVVDSPVVSLFLLDTRTHREPAGAHHRFASDADLDRLADWASHLDRPGVVFIPQPPTDGGAVYFRLFTRAFDTALVNYKDQYRRLWGILGDRARRHDLMVISGDIHWNRVRTATTSTGRTVYEYVSSGLTHNSESPDTPEPAHYEYEANGTMPFGLGSFVTDPNSKANWEAKVGTVQFRQEDAGVHVEVITWPLGDATQRPLKSEFTLR